ncbi:hypothetical protein [Paenibacillus sp. FSL K6-2859]|uniref:hypothetical protein n=1 Tax=Paenibacillus sp. FSL K6-2859 TaxID=2921482 RepID=UPI0030F90744
MPGKINVHMCAACGDESRPEEPWCFKCRRSKPLVRRDKLRVTGDFTVVDWFSSRSSAGLIVEDADGKRYPMYMSDVFAMINGLQLVSRTLEETKKGSAYGWALITKEAV